MYVPFCHCQSSSTIYASRTCFAEVTLIRNAPGPVVPTFHVGNFLRNHGFVLFFLDERGQGFMMVGHSCYLIVIHGFHHAQSCAIPWLPSTNTRQILWTNASYANWLPRLQSELEKSPCCNWVNQLPSGIQRRQLEIHSKLVVQWENHLFQ